MTCVREDSLSAVGMTVDHTLWFLALVPASFYQPTTASLRNTTTR